MNLERIITLADKGVKLRFLAMERSLRAQGCKLPISVIPYSEKRFELPEGSSWWVVPKVLTWLDSNSSHPAMRKYQCLTTKDYQFVDADVCFLRNPEGVLASQQGFITSCTHWHNVGHTTTDQVIELLKGKTTTWQMRVFNSGQFACSESLYTVDELISVASSEKYSQTALHFPHNEQPGFNLLVNRTDIDVVNLTLPPFNMESTWAGDYPEDYKRYWTSEDRTPYLIHWAGILMEVPRPINEIFLSYLTKEEAREWSELIRDLAAKRRAKERSLKERIRRFFKR